MHDAARRGEPALSDGFVKAVGALRKVVDGVRRAQIPRLRAVFCDEIARRKIRPLHVVDEHAVVWRAFEVGIEEHNGEGEQGKEGEIAFVHLGAEDDRPAEAFLCGEGELRAAVLLIDIAHKQAIALFPRLRFDALRELGKEGGVRDHGAVLFEDEKEDVPFGVFAFELPFLDARKVVALFFRCRKDARPRFFADADFSVERHRDGCLR